MSDDELVTLDNDERSAARIGDAERAILGADPTQTKPLKRETKAQRIERELREADNFWRGILATVIGRRELWRIACGSGGAHAFETKFPAGPTGFPDANAAWHARGEQDFGLRLYHHWLQLDPAAVGQMHRENDSRFQKPKGE